MRSVFLNSSSVQRSPSGFRVHIGFFGRRNVGKSSLLNALSHQHVSIVSEHPGTTTDPVKKAIELPRIGPAILIDTAGLDDSGDLGAQRVKRTMRVIERADIGVIVSDGKCWGEIEEQMLERLVSSKIPPIVVFNKADLEKPDRAIVESLASRGVNTVTASATEGRGINDLLEALMECARIDALNHGALISDLVGPKEMVILVVPIDQSAPKGRLILPQQQALREILDIHGLCLVVQSNELEEALFSLRIPPKLVVTDSQAFQTVADIVPKEVPLTSFSILFSRFKGDLVQQVRGAVAIDALKNGDRVLIAEACAHHPTSDDIGRVKLPGLIKKRLGDDIDFEVVQGRDFPQELSRYKLVIHCGACVWNRREMSGRLAECRRAGVPVTNYGLAIAFSLGILGRALEPFPHALEVFMCSPVSSPCCP